MHWLRCYNFFCPKENFLVKWQVVQICCSPEEALVLKLCILFTSSSSNFGEVEVYIPALEKIPLKKTFLLLLRCTCVKKMQLTSRQNIAAEKKNGDEVLAKAEGNAANLSLSLQNVCPAAVRILAFHFCWPIQIPQEPFSVKANFTPLLSPWDGMERKAAKLSLQREAEVSSRKIT